MARLTCNINDTINALEGIFSIPDSVANEMMTAQANVVAEKQKQVGREMGVYRTGGNARIHYGGKQRPTPAQWVEHPHLSARIAQEDPYRQGRQRAGNPKALCKREGANLQCTQCRGCVH